MACISGGTLPYRSRSYQLSALSFQPERAKRFRLIAESRQLTAPGTRSFGAMLSPDHYRCLLSRPVSYYALFKWWLLLSQHPGCLRVITSFTTERILGTLAGGLGCFPLDREACPSRSDSRDSCRGIRSLIERGKLEAPSIHSVALPPRHSGTRLALKLFRGEPAVSRFD